MIEAELEKAAASAAAKIVRSVINAPRIPDNGQPAKILSDYVLSHFVPPIVCCGSAAHHLRPAQYHSSASFPVTSFINSASFFL